MTADATGHDDFASFVRTYGRSGIHAVAAALLTLFGLLYSLTGDWPFLAVGAAIYVLPAGYLYVAGGGSTAEASTEDERNGTDADDAASERGAATGGAVTGDPDPEVEAAVPESEPDPGAEPDPSAEPSDADSDTGSEPSFDRSRDSVADADPESEPASESESKPESEPEPKPESEPAHEPTAKSDDGTGVGSDRGTVREWTTATVPTDATLRDAADADGATYAVGDGGVLLARRDGRWESVFGHGPGAEGQTLRGVDASDDGGTVWVAGDGGALGVYDRERGRHLDLSAPADLTSTWTDVAVRGPAGGETVFLVNGSGVVLRGSRDPDGEGSDVEWADPTKPGSGSSLTAVVASAAEGRTLACDSNGSVFEAADGTAFERIGVDGADALQDLTAGGGRPDGADPANGGGPATVEAVAADGRVHRRAEGVWTPRQVAEVALNGVARGGGDVAVVGDGGTVAVRSDESGPDGGWEHADVPTEATLRGAALPDDGAWVVVGDDGTVLEGE